MARDKFGIKARRIALTFAVAAMTFASGAAANEIYKWTDENGNIHYEDRPSGAASEERLSMSYRRTDSAAVNQRIQARNERQTARDEARSVAEAEEQEAADKAAEAAERAQACERARARLETYLQSRRLYRTDESGERVYLDDTERQEARQKAEEQITEFCS
jgi:hypothetical protein